MNRYLSLFCGFFGRSQQEISAIQAENERNHRDFVEKSHLSLSIRKDMIIDRKVKPASKRTRILARCGLGRPSRTGRVK